MSNNDKKSNIDLKKLDHHYHHCHRLADSNQKKDAVLTIDAMMKSNQSREKRVQKRSNTKVINDHYQ